MTECEHIIDTLLHKQYVLESSTILIKYLYENNRPEDALNLAKKCARHDNSKFEGEEIAEFIKLDRARKSMLDSNEEISEELIGKYSDFSSKATDFKDKRAYYIKKSISLINVCSLI